MTTTVRYSSSDCHQPSGTSPIVWSGVAGGALTMSPTGSYPSGPFTTFATIPITTGSIQLVAGLWAFVWISYRAASGTAGLVALADRKLVTSVQGAASFASYVNNGTSAPSSPPIQNGISSVVGDKGMVFEAPDGLGNYLEIVAQVNGSSGDLDLKYNCYSTDRHGHPGVSWDFSELSAEYTIVGGY